MCVQYWVFLKNLIFYKPNFTRVFYKYPVFPCFLLLFDILSIPTGEPQEHHLGEVPPKKFELHKIHERQMNRKGRYSLAHFLEKCKKKLKDKSQEWKNIVF